MGVRDFGLGFSTSFRQEWGVEMRRHAGNPQLPPALRDRLRDSAKRALARTTETATPRPPRSEPRLQGTSRETSSPQIGSAQIGSVAFDAVVRPDHARSRILFVMLQPGFIRYYEDALLALAADGHHVHLAFEIDRDKLGESALARRLAAASSHITIGAAPPRLESVRDFLSRSDRTATRSGRGRAAGVSRREEAWASLATTVRLLGDTLRFFDPVFAQAVRLRERAEKRLPRIYLPVVHGIAGAGATARRGFAAALRGIESMIPTESAIDRFFGEHDPDLLLVTPLIELGSQQVDYVKCARRRGVRSALCVASWDNLTSKGLMRVVPDHVVVWNSTQTREAVELHGADPAHVITTGAQVFDRWFSERPSRSREEFCRAVGLDPSRPFVLYVGSSVFIAPDEVPFASRWLATLRGSTTPVVAGAGALIRPHPANARQWQALDVTRWTNVALWPAVAADPTSADAQRDYFDSLYHSAAVVGINTSAQIEAAIVGRPVLTIEAPEFGHSQGGTLHFHHLVAGGAVRAARSLDEHVHHLAEVLSGVDAGAAAREAFVRSFVRPHGIDAPASPRFAAEIGRLAVLPAPPSRGDGMVVILRPAAMLLAFVARALAEDRPLWAYALRPAVTLAVRIAAVWYRLRMLLNAATSKSVRQRWRQLRWRARQRSQGSDPGQTPERDDSRH